MPYKEILGNLCNHDENIVINSLKKLDKNFENFNAYKNKITKYVHSLSYPNENFNKELLDLFQDK